MTSTPHSPSKFWLPTTFALATLVGIVSLTACSAESASSAPQLTAASIQRGQDSAKSLVDTRKLVHHAELALQVDAYEDARAALDAELARVGGFVQTANVRHHEGSVSSAHLVLSIPSASLSEMLDTCTTLGAVTRETLTSRDVTETHFDLQARLTNARQLEARLLGLLESEARDLEDFLKVERELARVRETIERFDGKLLLLDTQVAFSTLIVDLTTRERFDSGVALSFNEELGQTISGSVSGLIQFGKLGLLAAAGLLPWAVMLLLITWLGLRVLRMLGRRTAPRAPGHAG